MIRRYSLWNMGNWSQQHLEIKFLASVEAGILWEAIAL